jgi:hypothetical protein
MTSSTHEKASGSMPFRRTSSTPAARAFCSWSWNRLQLGLAVIGWTHVALHRAERAALAAVGVDGEVQRRRPLIGMRHRGGVGSDRAIVATLDRP